MNSSIFKAYDIRGKYPSEINESIASEIISKFLSRKIKNQSFDRLRIDPEQRRMGQKSPKHPALFPKRAGATGQAKFKILIAHDTRLSSPILYKAIIDCLKAKSYKLKAIPAGIATTPMFYFLVNYFKADGGIMITASHNPKEYNGLKIVGKNAVPISGKEILRIMNRE